MARPRKKLLIVDGYNVLRSGSRYRPIDDPDYTDDAFNKARETLKNEALSTQLREAATQVRALFPGLSCLLCSRATWDWVQILICSGCPALALWEEEDTLK